MWWWRTGHFPGRTATNPGGNEFPFVNIRLILTLVPWRVGWREIRNQVGIYFLAWTAYGLYSSLQTAYRFNGRYNLVQSFTYEMSYAWVAGLFSPFVVWMARRFPVTGPSRYRHWAYHVGASVLYAIATKLTWDRLGIEMGTPSKAWQSLSAWERLIRSVNSATDFAFALYWIVVLGVQAYLFYSRYQESKLKAAELEGQLVQAQLQALKMQLNPHFLFNTLHAVSALVQEEPESAERMIARLSDLLRMVLEDAGTHEVPLERELQFVRLYLDIEKIRLADRLQVSFLIDPDCRSAIVPNLVLQPLVENAIRHGIARSPNGGHIEIVASQDCDTLVLSVSDTGSGIPQNSREGVGIGATKARLLRLYGKCQSFELRNRAPSGAEVRIELPLRHMRDMPELTGAARTA